MVGGAPAPRASPRGLAVRADRHGVVVEDHGAGALTRWDAEGRWRTVARKGGTVSRSLLGRVVGADGGEVADPAAADAIAAAAARAATAALLRLDGAAGDPAVPAVPADAPVELLGDPAHARALLVRAAAWTAAALRSDAARAGAVWPEGVPILPPHRGHDVVVDVARGCPNAACSFCVFYRDRPFAPLSDEAFAAHLDAVVGHLGAALLARDGVFLGSASAVSLADAVLLRRLETIERRLGRRPRGVAAFLDPDHAPRRDVLRFSALRDAGLADVTVGLETGLLPLRAEVGKRGDLHRLHDAVAGMKAAGMRVAVTVLDGLGGETRAAAHEAATVEAVGALPLAAGDLVYVSALTRPGAPARRAASRAERGSWRDALASRTAARVAVYPAATFVAR